MQQDQFVPLRPHAARGFLDPLQQQAAIGQPGQGVVVGQETPLRFLLAARLLAGAQRLGALADPLLEGALGCAQFLLDLLALAHFAGQLAVQLVAGAAGVLLEGHQRLVLEALQQVAQGRAVDLPGADQQRRQQDQAEHPPALQLGVGATEQVQTGGQQAGHGEGQEGAQAGGIGDAGGNDRRHQDAVDQRLLQRRGQRDEQHADQCQGDARGGGAEQEGLSPGRGGLQLGRRLLEGTGLPQAQAAEQAQPGQQAAEQERAVLTPEQGDATQAAEQHQQGGQARAAVQLAGQRRVDLRGIVLTYVLRRDHRRGDIRRKEKGHECCLSCCFCIVVLDMARLTPCGEWPALPASAEFAPSSRRPLECHDARRPILSA
ncbi:hypothetical protein D3C81_1119520 [compost metagenome]